MIGADYWVDNIESLALDGRYVLLAFMSGTKVPDFNIAPLLRKRLRVSSGSGSSSSRMSSN